MPMTFEQSVLTCVSLAAVAVLAAMGVVVCVSEFHLSAIRQSLRDFRRLPWYVQLFLVAFVSHFVVYGSVKTNQTENAGVDVTNAPPMMLMMPPPPAMVTSGDSAQDCQLHTFPHWRHGVYEDGQRVEFDDDWVLPYGTNRLTSVEVMSWGEILPNGFATTPIVALGCRLSLVPEVSDFQYCRTPSNSYRFVWTNARDRRVNGLPISGCIELFRNGDVFVETNGVGSVTPRVIPFHHDGFGQNDVWVRANFTNAEEILSVGYANWVDDQVGIDLTNGLFKFTAYFPEIPPEATELVVGDYSVCVTNAGEYVFVVEKGKEYSFHTEPYDETVEYSMQDDMAPSAPVFMSMWFGDAPGVWSIDGGGYWLDYPGYGYFGYFGWLPMLQGSPNVSHLGPDDFPKTFEATLSDYCGSETPVFRWGSSDENIQFATPNAQQTEVECLSLPSWGTFSASVEADFGWYSLYSYLSPTYGTNDSPTVLFSSSAPEIVFLNDDNRTSRWYRVWLDFGCEIGTNATVTLSHTGSTGIRFAADPDGGHSLTWSEVLSRVAAMPSVSYVEFYIACASIGRGEFVAECAIAGGDVRTKRMPYNVIEPLRKLVCTDPAPNGGYYNPSRLVYGTNAWLMVGVNGAFSLDDVEWRIVSGPGEFVSSSRNFACVRATAPQGTVVVEAAFGHDSTIQPRFVLPIVTQRVLPVRAFVVGTNTVSSSSIESKVKCANRIFMQVGVKLDLISVSNHVAFADDYIVSEYDYITNSYGRVDKRLSVQARRIMDAYAAGDCLELYFVAKIINGKAVAFRTPYGIIISQRATDHVVAHEIGHCFGLEDCYATRNTPIGRVWIPRHNDPIDDDFMSRPHDWGAETRRGFYEKSDDRKKIIYSFLMYGVDGKFGVDIPSADVLSLMKQATLSSDTKRSMVGADYFKTNNSEVYSR